MAHAAEFSDDGMDDFIGSEAANSQSNSNKEYEMIIDNDSTEKISPKGILKNGKRGSSDDEIEKNLTSTKNKKRSNIDSLGRGIFLNNSQSSQKQNDTKMNLSISNSNGGLESSSLGISSELHNSNSNLSQISNTSVLTQSETTDFFPTINFRMSHFMKHHRSPFTIHVFPSRNDVKSNLPSKVGNLLYQRYPNNISEVFQINRRKVGITISDRKTANSLLDDHIFPDNGFNVVIPIHLITTDAVIKGVPVEFSTQQIVQLANADGQYHHALSKEVKQKNH
ncbi:hypothetical protein QAD02_008483 [Eretmocerus hayati]|uniref:Uncharacterized protein n=1 Tax=Eretmocerus hayati TaxID=131215 RepID=A0ACC2N7Y9_9HYME|nr:hypothetical protein QAD02_008483 [Eretmocerus hayati]